MNVSPKAVESWTPPLTNTDGTPLTDLAFYNIKMGTTSGSYNMSAKIMAPATSDNLLAGFPGLASGTYFAIITAVNSVGAESSPSNEIVFTLVNEVPSAPVNFSISG